MRALLITVGSRGDAEPFQALADALTAGGHFVEFFLQAEHDFVPARPERVTLHALPFSTTDFYKHAANPRHGQDSDNPRIKFVGVIVEVVCLLVLLWKWSVLPCMEDVSRVAKECDVLICSSLPRHMCFCIGKALQKPVALLHLQPMAPTKAFPHYSSGEAVECILKGLESSEEHERSYQIPEQCNFDFLQESLATVVTSTGSAMISFDELWSMLTGTADLVYSFNCFSTDLCPAPTHGHIHDVGALADRYLPSNFVAAPALVEFLAQRKPVAIGFGSMPFKGAQVVISSLETLDYPAVLVGEAMANFEETDWTKNVLQVNSVAYPWLLPQCRCMVSHGGAGVLHSTLRAGIPAIIAPLMGDQFFHAKLIQARQLGMDAGPMTSLTADALIETLQHLDTPQGVQWLANAQAFALQIQEKNAPLELVKHLENLTK